MSATVQQAKESLATNRGPASWKQKLGLVAMAVALTLLTGEVGLRVAGYDRTYVNPLHSFHEGDPELGYRGRPDFVGRFYRPEFDVLVEHDNHGFRKHVYAPTQAAKQRVFVLGDSFTWGFGVPQGAVYTDQLSRALADREIVNLGLNASGTAQQLAVFRKHAVPRIKPGDAVVLEFFQNDFFDNTAGPLPVQVVDGRVTQIGPPRPMESSLKAWLKDHSRLANVAIYAADVWQLNARRRKAQPVVWTENNVVAENDIVAARHLLSTFQQECAALDARLYVVYVPGQAEMGESTTPEEFRDRRDAGFRKAFLRCVEGLPLEVVDLLPGFEKAQAANHQRLTFAGDEHWNAEGHRVAAELIEQRLR